MEIVLVGFDFLGAEVRVKLLETLPWDLWQLALSRGHHAHLCDQPCLAGCDFFLLHPQSMCQVLGFLTCIIVPHLLPLLLKFFKIGLPPRILPFLLANYLAVVIHPELIRPELFLKALVLLVVVLELAA